MPEATFHVELITPQGRLVSTEALYLELPGEDGRLGIMANHQPAIIGLAAGIVTIRDSSGNTSTWSTGRGHATISPLGVTVVTRDATLN
jgi:F-type H+-transporting ATPase subunit epsilon